MGAVVPAIKEVSNDILQGAKVDIKLFITSAAEGLMQ